MLSKRHIKSVLLGLVGTSALGLATGVSAGAARAAGPATPSAWVPLLTSAPTAAPPAPFVTSVAGDGLSLAVAWLPLESVHAVTSYGLLATPVIGSSTPTCPSPTPVSAVAGGTDSAGWIKGLCARVAYQVTMTASNSVGTGPASLPSVPGVPLDAQPPRPPMITSVVPRSGSLAVTWSPSATDGGATITGHKLTVTRSDGTVAATLSPAPTAKSATVSGLTNGTTYGLALTASNTIGASSVSAATGTPSVAYLPSAPQQLTVTPGAGAIGITWVPPADDGGAAVSGYTITYQRAQREADGTWSVISGAPVHTLNATAAATAATATTFEDPTASYLFSLTATNAVGIGTTAGAATGVRPAVEIKPGTITLSSASVASISALDVNTVSFTSPPAQVTTAEVGNVLVAGSSTTLPGGLLRKITAIANTGSTVTMTTAEAAIDDFFTNMTLATTLDPNAAGAAGGQVTDGSRPTFRAASPGVRSLAVTADGIGGTAQLSRTLAIEKKYGSTFISAQMKVRAELEVEIGVHQNRVGIPDGVTADASLEAGISLEGKVGFSGTKEWPLGTIEGSNITFMVGPVPVVIHPYVPVSLTASGEVSMSVSTSVTIGGGSIGAQQTHGILTPRTSAKPPASRAGLQERSQMRSVQPPAAPLASGPVGSPPFTARGDPASAGPSPSTRPSTSRPNQVRTTSSSNPSSRSKSGSRLSASALQRTSK